LNADSRRLSRQAKKLEAGSRTYDKNYCAGHADGRRYFFLENLRKSALDLRLSALRNAFLEFFL